MAADFFRGPHQEGKIYTKNKSLCNQNCQLKLAASQSKEGKSILGERLAD